MVKKRKKTRKKKKVNNKGMTAEEWIMLILCIAVIVAVGTFFK
tara:strand:+ start:481 stop:609 length:129 start_codon:yes stop_codon:yes gene_type:complete